jgi:hypothetical protein
MSRQDFYLLRVGGRMIGKEEAAAQAAAAAIMAGPAVRFITASPERAEAFRDRTMGIVATQLKILEEK